MEKQGRVEKDIRGSLVGLLNAHREFAAAASLAAARRVGIPLPAANIAPAHFLIDFVECRLE
jgi:hypothetical protein